jgi:hypothetical protein
VHGAAVKGEMQFRLKGSWRKLPEQQSGLRAELAGTVISTTLDDVREGDEVQGQVDIWSLNLALVNVPLGWPPPAIELRFTGGLIRTDQHPKIPTLDRLRGVLPGSITTPSGENSAVTITYSYWDLE